MLEGVLQCNQFDLFFSSWNPQGRLFFNTSGRESVYFFSPTPSVSSPQSTQLSNIVTMLWGTDYELYILPSSFEPSPEIHVFEFMKPLEHLSSRFIDLFMISCNELM